MRVACDLRMCTHASTQSSPRAHGLARLIARHLHSAVHTQTHTHSAQRFASFPNKVRAGSTRARLTDSYSRALPHMRRKLTTHAHALSVCVCARVCAHCIVPVHISAEITRKRLAAQRVVVCGCIFASQGRSSNYLVLQLRV